MNSQPDLPLVPIERAELATRLRWFIRLRWLAGATVLIGGLALELFPIEGVRGWVVVTIGAGILTYNLVFHQIEQYESGAGRDVLIKRAPVAAIGQIGVDLLALTILLHATGGIENPLSACYVFHVVIATLLLPTREVFGVVAFAVLLFAGLCVAEMNVWLPHANIPLLQGSYRDWPSVLITLSAFSGTLLIAVFLGTSVAKKLRSREQEIIELEMEVAEHAHELELANEALVKVDEVKTHYFRKVSHDLKAPVAAQQSLLRTLLIELPDLAAASRSRIERAITRGDDLLALVQDLLTLSRMSDATKRPGVKAIDPARAVLPVVETLEINAREKGLEWFVEMAGNLPPIQLEPDKLATVVENLLSNAIKYTPPGGKVSLRVFAGDGALILEVRDTGIGIAEADIARIGEEFFRTQQARGSGSSGTGLGMTIVRSVIESMGGRMAIQSALGAGTTVTVTLPRQPNSVEYLEGYASMG